MKIYADANFFTATFALNANTDEALALITPVTRGESAPLPITRLLRLEIINAFQRLVFETRQGTQELAMTPEAALLAEANFFDSMAEGKVWRESQVDDAMLESGFQTLVHRHTARHGFRTYDILHVANALLLGCDTFWSFDAKAKKLAKLEGMATN